MSDDGWKTIRVPVSAYNEAKQLKEEYNRTWGEQLVADDTKEMTVVDVDAIDDAMGQGVVVETVEINESGGVDGTDVENIIESWMEKNADKLRRGGI